MSLSLCGQFKWQEIRNNTKWNNFSTIIHCYTHTCIYTYTYIHHTFIHICIHKHSCTTHTYAHTYIYTCMHTRGINMQCSFAKATNKSKGIRDDNTRHGCRRVNIMLLHLNYYRDHKKIDASLFTSNTMGNELSFSNNMSSFQAGIHPKTLVDSLDILYVPHFSLFRGIESRNIINYGSQLS